MATSSLAAIDQIKGARRVGRYVLLTVMAVIVLFPIYVMVVGALKPGDKVLDQPLLPSNFTFDTLRDAWNSGHLGRALINFYGAGEGFASLTQSFNDNGPLMILIGAISPIPYKVITITSGVAGLDLWTFVFYGLLGRGARYFIPCGLFYFFGPAANGFIEKHKAAAVWGMIVLAIAGFAAAPLLFPKGDSGVSTVIEAQDTLTDLSADG